MSIALKRMIWRYTSLLRYWRLPAPAFVTRLLLAVTFIVQISEAIYYTFYGQFYGPSEVWLAFVETKDIASGISDSLSSLGIYFLIMLVAVLFSLFAARRGTGMEKVASLALPADYCGDVWRAVLQSD